MNAFSRLLASSVVVLLGALPACDGQAPTVPQNTKVVAALGQGLVIEQPSEGALYYLAGDLKHPTFGELYRAEDANIQWVVRGQGTGLEDDIFCMLTPQDPRDPDQTTRLIRLQPPSLEATTYKLDLAFGSVRFSSDGRYTALLNLEGDEAPGFYNPGEMAILDASTGPGDDNPKRITLDTKGRAIRDIVFLEPLTIGHKSRRLAAVNLRGAIKLIDLEDPSAATPIIPLSGSSDGSNVFAVQLKTQGDTDIRPAMLFVLSNQSTDIFAISLTVGEQGEASIAASINQLEAGGTPSGLSLRVDADTGALHALVLARTGYLAHVAVIDVDTSDRFLLELEDTANRMVELDDGDLAMFGEGGTRLHFLAVSEVLSRKEAALSEVKLHDTIEQILPIDNLRFIATGHGSNEALLVDLQSRQATRLYLGGEFYDWSNGAVFEDIAYMLLPEGNAVGLVDLAANHPSSLLLDDFANAVYLLEDKRIGVAWHEVAWGRVTLFSLDDPSRATASIYDGFLMSGVLD